MFAAVQLALTLMVLPLQAQAAVDPQRWTLTDSSGHAWGLTLFEQPDPAYPAGWRLRLTARSPVQVVDHQRPLRLSDGLGGAWTLPNRSEELVRQGEDLVPQSSAQFDASALDPRPSDVLPLQLEVPTDRPEGSILVMLQPEVVQALHELPLSRAAIADPALQRRERWATGPVREVHPEWFSPLPGTSPVGASCRQSNPGIGG